MKKIAILASDDMLPGAKTPRLDQFELKEQMAKITAAFAQKDLQAVLKPWRNISETAEDYAAVLPLFVWDYFSGNKDVFLAEMARTDQKTHLFNNYETLFWNSDKRYLDALGHAGAPVIPTIMLETVTQTGLSKAIDTLGAEKVVIKPIIGGGAWRQALYEQGSPLPDRRELPPEGALIQPFLPSVQEEGEYSFLYFGGSFSHAVLKQPKSGDYRIQSIYGGKETPFQPDTDDRQTARSILDTLDFIPLYARVDLLRGLDGQLKLIELEVIEPYLYLSHSPGEGAENKGAQKLTDALLKRLGS